MHTVGCGSPATEVMVKIDCLCNRNQVFRVDAGIGVAFLEVESAAAAAVGEDLGLEVVGKEEVRIGYDKENFM